MPQTERAIKRMMSEDDFCIFQNDACFLSHFLFSKKEQAERGLFHKVCAICIYVFAANLTYIFLFHERKTI